MDDEAKKLIKEQYAKLPPVLQEAMQSAHLHEQIAAIGAKHQLHIDQMGLLEDEVMFLMMGFTEPIEFPGHLQENLNISAEVAQKLAIDINENILLPIRDRMENNTTEVETPTNITNPPAVSTPPIAPVKSVVMPSSIAAQAALSKPSLVMPEQTLASTDTQINAPQAQDALAAPTTVPNITPQPHEADVVLTEPTISMPKKVEQPVAPATTPAAAAPTVPNITAKVEPPKAPPVYKADPYREPIE